MGFLVTTLIFIVIGVIASLLTRICCNRGPSTNLWFAVGYCLLLYVDPKLCLTFFKLHLTLIITATVCCWMMWAIVYLSQMNPLIVPILNESE